MAAHLKHAVYAQSLICKNEQYDAVFHLQIIELGNERYQVDAQWGRSGGTLSKKTGVPTTLPTALREFNNTIAQKTSEGRERVFRLADQVTVPDDVRYKI